MARPPKHGILPVSRKDLAEYLGISPTLMTLASSNDPSRNLRSQASLRLSSLELSHLQLSKKSRDYQPPVPAHKKKALETAARKLEADAASFTSKAVQLRFKLEKMQEEYESARQWMYTVEQLLEKLPANKESKFDKAWLNNQQGVSTEKMDKNGLQAQLKVEMEIQLLEAKATISRNAAGKIRGGYGSWD